MPSTLLLVFLICLSIKGRHHVSSFSFNKVKLKGYLPFVHISVQATRRKGFDSSNKSDSETSSNTSSSTSKKISKSLAEWAASSSSTTSKSPTTTNTAAIDTVDTDSSSSSATFTPFTKPKENDNDKGLFISRRGRQRARLATESTKLQVTLSIVQNIQNILNEKNFNVSTLLTQIHELIHSERGSSTSISTASWNGGGLKAFFLQNSTVRQYKLAWVSSDECLSYIGTGLHKVPLARLEDVFLSLGPKRSWILYEVIRILGPFPNVRNTLNGKIMDLVPKATRSSISSSSTATSNQSSWDLNLQYDSMIDGTGREILAGKAENVRNIKLEVLFADENALVCIMPSNNPSMDTNTNILHESSNILLFLKEDALDARLKALRVSN